MKEIERYLPGNCWKDVEIDPKAIVIHYMSAINIAPEDPYNLDRCWNILEDYGVSAHIIIGRTPEDGVMRCVPTYPNPKKAYHAGKSEYKGLTNWNNFSIGIELVGTKDSGFTDYQYDACRWLVNYYMKKYNIPWDMVVGHETIAPGRKADPGIATGNFIMDRIKTIED